VAQWSHFPVERRYVDAARELVSIPENGPPLFYVEGGYLPTVHYLARRRGLIIQAGAHPHSSLYREYREFLVLEAGQRPPDRIAHFMEGWRLKERYHHWQVYTRSE